MADSTKERGLELVSEVFGRGAERFFREGLETRSGPVLEMGLRNCFGDVWASDALPRKTRSFIVLAILAAGSYHAEFKTHVRGALRNGATREELVELVRMIYVYCGIPASMFALRALNETFDEIDQKAAR